MSYLLEKYKNKRRLGKGAYGDVLLVEDPTGQQYAIKLISKKSISKEPYLLEYLEGEKDCMMSVKSRYVMDLIKVQEDENYVYLICEYCDGGDLLNYQAKQEKKVFSIKDATKILSEVIHGLFLLHEMGYLHRDIKPQNILLKKDKAGNNMYKLADFGFAKKNEDVGGTVLGTEHYMSPEIYSNDHYGYEVDMWAFGVLFYFMLNMEFPFRLNPHSTLEQKRQDLIKQAYNFSYTQSVKKSKKKIVENCTPEVEDLFKKMFETNPEKRLTFAEIREHKLFAEYFRDVDKQTSKIVSKIYDKKNKVLDRATSFIQKSGIQKQGVKNNIKNNPVKPQTQKTQEEPENVEPSYSVKRYKGTLEKEILELEYAKIDFLYESEEELAVNLNFLDAEEVLALRYNLLKFYVMLLKNFIRDLKPDVYEDFYKKRFPNLNWKEFFKSKQFLTIKRQSKEDLDKAQIKISQTYDQCRNSLPIIRKYNPKLELVLETEVTETSFEGKFKDSYRISTMGVYEKVRVKISNGNRYFYLTALLALCHGYNRIMEADYEQLSQIFKEYIATSTKKQSNLVDFSELRSWMTRADKQKLKKLFVGFLNRYFQNVAVN